MSCEKTSFLIEKSELSKLSLKEKLSMRIHLLWCSLCKKYKSDSKVLGKILKALHKHEDGHTHVHLSSSEKEELKRKLASS
jgi:hypothetical protein